MSYSYRESTSYSENDAALQGYASIDGASVLSSSGVSYSVNGGSNVVSSGSANLRQVASDLLQLSGQSSVSISQQQQQQSSSSSSGVLLSAVEQAILRSTVPIEINESEEITVLGQRGIWANRAEVINWRGIIPISEYQINEDANPEVITKRVNQQLEYIQELAIRYLRPPTPPSPGEILIVQQANTLTPPAPPLVIRQQPARPSTPEPLVIREAPPQPPLTVGRKQITISGRRIPPPPRKVVIERLAPLPAKPQSVIIERWLPYAQVKRRVVFQRAEETNAVVVKPRNVIIQWDSPQVVIRKEIKYLGVIRANPVEYVQRYGSSLKVSRELPQFVLDIKTPEGLVLAADYQYNSVHELEGEVQALNLIDLDREGLSEYRSQLARYGAASSGSAAVVTNSASSVVSETFSTVTSESLSVKEAEKLYVKLLLRLNSRLGTKYGIDDVTAFFQALDPTNSGSVNSREFRAAFERKLQ